MATRNPLGSFGLLLLGAALMALGVPAAAPAAEPAPVPAGLEPGDPIPGELVVRIRGRNERRISLPEGVAHNNALRALEKNPAVASASRDYVVGVAANRDDPGTSGKPGGWRDDQWNFLDTPGGINVGPAWGELADMGRPFGRFSIKERGTVVAIVDTGVAYRYAKRGRFKRSPDLAKGLFERGRDFVDGDRKPLDLYGHGTHMASTIAEGVFNGRGVRGIAPGVRLMPVRVLDRFGSGRTSTVAKGVRWAANHGAKIINTSIEYGSSVKKCSDVPALCRAFRMARRKGALVVAAAGNNGRRPVPVPSRTLVVGAATIRGCLAAYSNRGPGVDLLAPGGGRDARSSGEGCDPKKRGNPGIVQLTVTPRKKRYTRFAYPRTVGTSSAAAHASGVAALVIASGIIGPDPAAVGITRRLQQTGRPGVGLPQNAGPLRLLDAAAAVGATEPILPPG